MTPELAGLVATARLHRLFVANRVPPGLPTPPPAPHRLAGDVETAYGGGQRCPN